MNQDQFSGLALVGKHRQRQLESEWGLTDLGLVSGMKCGSFLPRRLKKQVAAAASQANLSIDEWVIQTVEAALRTK